MKKWIKFEDMWLRGILGVGFCLLGLQKAHALVCFGQKLEKLSLDPQFGPTRNQYVGVDLAMAQGIEQQSFLKLDTL